MTKKQKNLFPGCGFAKMGSNYAPTIWISEMAQKFNCHQALWLYGPDLEITEVGAMNLFAFFDHGNGNRELVTPGLENGMILPGLFTIFFREIDLLIEKYRILIFFP